MPDAGARPAEEVILAAIEPDASVVVDVDVKVVHPDGTPGDPVIVSAVLGLKPFADKNATTLAVPLGA